MPSSVLRDSNGAGADRNAKRGVLREVPGRIETNDEPTDGLNAEEDSGEETEGVSSAASTLEGVRESNRRDEAVSGGAGGPQSEEEAADARAPEQAVLEREPKAVLVRSLDPKQPATGTTECAAEMVEKW